MTNKTDKTLASMLIIGVFSAIGVYYTMGERAAIAASAGSALAIANWLALCWITKRILGTGQNKKNAAGLFLLLKFAILAGLVWFMLRVLHLDGVGFIIGLGASMVGMLIGAGSSAAPGSADADQGGQSAAR